MGNIASLILFFVSIYCGSVSHAVVYTKNGIACYKQSGSYLCESATQSSDHCVRVKDNNRTDNWKLCVKPKGQQKSPEELCSEKGPTFIYRNQKCEDFTKDSIDEDGTTKSACVSKGGDWKENELPHCCMDHVNPEEQKCKTDGGTWDSQNKTCKKEPVVEQVTCPSNTDPVTHGAKDESGKDIQEIHCKCKYATETGAISEYLPQKKYNQKNNCPTQPPKEVKKININELSDDGVVCLQKIRDKARTCVNTVLFAQQSCDVKDQKNSEYTGPINQAANQATQVLHMSGVSRNSAQQCLQAGLLSSATGFAYNQIHGNCSEAAKACEQSCDSSLGEYIGDANAIENFCKNGEGLQAGETDEQLQAEADKIAGILADANAKCNTNEDSAKALSNDLLNLYKQSNEAAKNSAACVCQVSGTCPFEDTNCISNPSAPGCANPFPDCTTNPTHAMCKCFGAKANDPGCKGGVSQMAALTPVTSGGGISGTIGSGASRGAGFDPALMGGGDGGEESASAATFSGNNNGAGDEKSMFQAAQATSGGGGGGGGGSGSGSGEGSAEGSGEPENKGLSGVFKSLGQSIKNTFGFGGGSKPLATTAKKDSKFNDPSKVQKSKLRTVATSNGYCVIKEDNSKICFGHKQTSIFEMINKGYVNQRESLLSK